MFNKKGKKQMVNNIDKSSVIKPQIDEKVEVLIKEVIRIRHQDFQAFKHALEDFVNSWDKYE